MWPYTVIHENTKVKIDYLTLTQEQGLQLYGDKTVKNTFWQDSKLEENGILDSNTGNFMFMFMVPCISDLY